MRQRKGISYIWPTKYEEWADGFLAGNGTLGIIVFGDPLKETVIFNHRKFNIAATHPRSFSQVSAEDLEEIRKACAQGDFRRANDLADQTHGWQDGGEGNRHPGYRMKIEMDSAGTLKNYVRECDFRTGEIFVRWENECGSFCRSTFVSRKDDVVVQKIAGTQGQPFDCRLQLGVEAGMHLPEGMEFFQENAENFLIFRALYPEPEKTDGAGYEGITRVVIQGEEAKAAVDGAQAAAAAIASGQTNDQPSMAAAITSGQAAIQPAFRITGAKEVVLITAIHRQDKDCIQEWEKKLLQRKLQELPADYDRLLQAHLPLHQNIYDRVSLDLEASEADRNKSNEELLQQQKASGTLQTALLERLFDAGRYHFMCAAGENGAPDLLGIWTGDCNVGWNGYYHLDANLNLQISGANVGNMTELMEGYFRLNEIWKEDFQTNAKKLLGCRGLLACGNTPGAASGLISALNYAYPYHYVTGEEAWLLYPFWEYYQITGDRDFLKNRLYPLLYELGLFYEDFLVEKDGNGKYIFAGSISPENQPEGLGLSLVNNSAFDIAGARFGLTTLLKVCEILGEESRTCWREILEHLPEYRINEDGALAEWAWEGLRDHYDHRHSSGLIGVYPYHEITAWGDERLYRAAEKALEMRDAYPYEDAGHGLLHAALIACVLKNAPSVQNKLLRLCREDFYFTGLGTAHYPEHKVFCTDVAHALPAILMEMLIYSEEGIVELLPALPEELKKGEITGVLGRSRLRIERLAWDMEKGQAECSITSGIAQKLTLAWKGQRKHLELNPAETVHIIFC